MTQRLCLVRLPFLFGMFALLTCGVAWCEPPKTALDKADPKKVPPLLRPKGTPKDVFAVLGERDGRYDSLAFRPDGAELAVSGPDGKVRIWDMATLKVIGATAHKEVVCMAYAPDGKSLAAGDSEGNLMFWTMKAGKLTLLGTYANAHKKGPIWALAFGPDSAILYTAGADKTMKIWDCAKMPPILKDTATGHEDRVRNLAVSHDGKHVATTSDRDKTIRIWDVTEKPKEDGKILFKPGALCVAFSPDDEKLAVGSLNGTLHTYKIGGDTFSETDPVRKGKGVFYSIEYAPDGKSILGLVKLDTLEDKTYVWDLAGKARYESKYGMKTEAVAFDPGGRHIVLANETSLYIIRLAP